ncbi:hypothetical protein PSA7680_01800 [Pseudoruegeria aquimaris]|uniref:Flp/Fap pilin component n=1 Tax=Pseudoruegeria aquimaris TaxID=393663 RepID=A0A1Y5SC60_9RHOB|nr:hypothetical protein [Pseudoruegeria aquimaris]SLN37395.1 hypothetical protein PSA7680_01800 [Pseudoruegeria aquimaris]
MLRHRILKTFKKDEDGAVTVDWVVLTAALVALTIAILPALWLGVDGAVDDMSASFTSSDSFSSQGNNVTATTVD